MKTKANLFFFSCAHADTQKQRMLWTDYAAFAAFFVLFLIFFLSEIDNGWALASAIVLNCFGLYLFFKFLGQLQVLKKNSTRRFHGLAALAEPGLVLASIVFGYAALLASYLLFEPDAFLSIPADASRGLVFRRSLFLSIETTMSLGSGAIVASPTAEGAYALIGMCTVHAYVFTTLVLAEFVAKAV